MMIYDQQQYTLSDKIHYSTACCTFCFTIVLIPHSKDTVQGNTISIIISNSRRWSLKWNSWEKTTHSSSHMSDWSVCIDCGSMPAYTNCETYRCNCCSDCSRPRVALLSCQMSDKQCCYGNMSLSRATEFTSALSKVTDYIKIYKIYPALWEWKSLIFKSFSKVWMLVTQQWIKYSIHKDIFSTGQTDAS